MGKNAEEKYFYQRLIFLFILSFLEHLNIQNILQTTTSESFLFNLPRRLGITPKVYRLAYTQKFTP
jgi:hypothetical protein